METAAPMELTDTPKTVANLLASARSVRVSALWTAAGVYGTPTMLTARAQQVRLFNRMTAHQ